MHPFDRPATIAYLLPGFHYRCKKKSVLAFSACLIVVAHIEWGIKEIEKKRKNIPENFTNEASFAYFLRFLCLKCLSLF